MKISKYLMGAVIAAGSMSSMTVSAADPDFHIYLCIGQSNMEGNAQIEPIDRQNVPENFLVMSAVDYNNPKRLKGEWYQAVPPLVRENTGLTPMDYFGRTMLANLPEGHRVGVVPVAIGGCKIEHLDKDFDASTLANEADWFKSFMQAYDNAPYKRLIECAKEAQKDGVISGILLHQGESNTGDPQWPAKVKKIYDDILSDLGLEANSIPLIAGEVVTSAKGGACGSMNPIINRLPETLPQARVASAANLDQKGDGLHFTAHAYRVLGCRYAEQMLATMGIDDPVVDYEEEKPYVPTPKPSEGDFVFDLSKFVPTIWADGTFDVATGRFKPGQWGFGGWEFDQPIDLSGYKYIVAELGEEERDNLEFRVFDTASYWEKSYEGKFNGGKLIVAELSGMMKNLETGITPLNSSKIYRVGFWGYGNNPSIIKQVYATNVNPYDVGSVELLEKEMTKDKTVYDMTGRKVADSLDNMSLPRGIYVCGGKKIALFVGE